MLRAKPHYQSQKKTGIPQHACIKKHPENFKLPNPAHPARSPPCLFLPAGGIR